MDNDHPIKFCEDYTSNSFYITPNCRKLGDLWNEEYFHKLRSKEFTFERKMCAEIKIIQCAGLSCRKGCSGGPVFDIHGKIVGMMVGEEVDGCQIALHVSLLKRFLNDSSTTTKGELKSKGTWEGEGTSKGASKRPLKRIAKEKDFSSSSIIDPFDDSYTFSDGGTVKLLIRSYGVYNLVGEIFLLMMVYNLIIGYQLQMSILLI